MSAACIEANIFAKEILASLKSGAPLKGIVRSHSTSDSADITWIGIQLPALGERQVSVLNEPELQPGQQVVVQCVPNPAKPDHYMFHLVSSAQQPAKVAKRGVLLRCAKMSRFRRAQG